MNPMKTMKKLRRAAVAIFIVAALMLSAKADTIHVALDGDNTTGADWATAFNAIADGLAVAQDGDTVLVAAGTYSGPLMNHVIGGNTHYAVALITNAVSLIAVDGPEMTKIQVTNYPGAVTRGLEIREDAAGALVAGFTVMNGKASYSWGGNVFMGCNAVISNCVITGANTPSHGGGVAATDGLVTHCKIHGNRVSENRSAGGIRLGQTLWPTRGTGTARLVNSLIYDNHSSSTQLQYPGGGVYAADNCVISNCTIVANSASVGGGGATLAGNAKMVNTIVSGNTLYNSTTPNNFTFANGANVAYSCVQPTTGLTGAGNTDGMPLLDAEYRPRLGSATIDAGVNDAWMTGATDLAGGNRVMGGSVDIGAYEFAPPDELTCGFTVDPASGADEVLVTLTAAVSGANLTGLVYRWDFDYDGETDNFTAEGGEFATATHTYQGGIYTVKLRVENSAGESAEFVLADAVIVMASETFVVETNPNAAHPYASWATAATNIQHAVDAAADNGTVTVTNGFYTVRATVIIDRPVTLRSVNGWDVTTLSGNNQRRTVELIHAGAVIDGFTVRGGSDNYGMGQNVWLHPGTARNCRITACHSSNWGQGSICADNGTVENCMVDGNTVSAQGPAGVDLRNASTMIGCLVFGNTNLNASMAGGGVVAKSAAVVIRNCTIVDNWSPAAKGAGLQLDNAATVVNTIIASNGVVNASGDYSKNVAGVTANISYSCVWPLTFTVDTQEKILETEPQFEDFAARDYRLWRASPLRDAGLNQSWMETAFDLDGNLRIDRRTVDIGAYEVPYVPPGTLIFLQ